MKWTLKLERIDEAGNLHSTTVAYVERPELTSEADLGLTHDDGKYLLRRVQAEVAQEQVRTLISKIRPCLGEWEIAGGQAARWNAPAFNRPSSTRPERSWGVRRLASTRYRLAMSIQLAVAEPQ